MFADVKEFMVQFNDKSKSDFVVMVSFIYKLLHGQFGTATVLIYVVYCKSKFWGYIKFIYI